MKKLATLAAIAGLGLAGCGSSPAPTHHAPAAVKKAGQEYIKRDRIIFPPEAARVPEVKYPNGTIKEGATEAVYSPIFGGKFGTTFKRINQGGLELIRRNEGFESCPYWDPFGGVWTIGIGEAYVSSRTPCESEGEAYAKLRYQVAVHYEPALRELGVDFNQNQTNALVDFVYNLGRYIFQISPILRYDLEHHEFYAASQQMLTYDIAGGAVLSALYRRRHEEVAIFLRPEPVAETAAQIKARKKRELVGHEDVLRGLRVRIKVLHRVTAADHCNERAAKHQKLGPKCTRWRKEEYQDHLHGVKEDAVIGKLHKEGIYA